jgi:hypothetical protein
MFNLSRWSKHSFQLPFFSYKLAAYMRSRLFRFYPIKYYLTTYVHCVHTSSRNV